MQRLRQLYAKIPAFLKNKYVVITLAFAIWMLFFDSNSLISQFHLYNTLRQQRQEKARLEQKIEEVKADREALFSSDEALERYAREKYWMKKDDEDIFIIVEEEQE